MTRKPAPSLRTASGPCTRNLGWDQAACAKNLHISQRTLHNWESGKHDIPYTAYRLLRLLNRMGLPGLVVVLLGACYSQKGIGAGVSHGDNLLADVVQKRSSHLC